MAKSKVTALLAGLLFGAGLLISGMTSPAKVRGFLDLFGRWDPSLAFVMIGAIGVHFLVLRRILVLPKPLLSATFQLPSRAAIDAPLVVGAALFGVGWGLSGYCPGPALVSLGTAATPVLVFIAAMISGIALARLALR